MSITLLNSITSVIAGFAIFSILGYIAANQGKDINEVVTEGKLECCVTLVVFTLCYFERKERYQYNS